MAKGYAGAYQDAGQGRAQGYAGAYQDAGQGRAQGQGAGAKGRGEGQGRALIVRTMRKKRAIMPVHRRKKAPRLQGFNGLFNCVTCHFLHVITA